MMSTLKVFIQEEKYRVLTDVIVCSMLSRVRPLQPRGQQHALADGIIHLKILLYQGDPSLKISW